MRKIKKQVVKEITPTTSMKTTTKTYQTECGCENFECLNKYKEDADFKVDENGIITFGKEKSHERNGNKLVMSMTTRITPIVVENGDNIIQMERIITEEITKAEQQPQSGKLDLKGLLEAMAGNSRQMPSELSDMIDDMVDGIVKRRKGKTSPDSSKVAEMLQDILGKKTGANVKVIDMSSFPSFEEFMKIMKDDSI